MLQLLLLPFHWEYLQHKCVFDSRKYHTLGIITQVVNRIILWGSVSSPLFCINCCCHCQIAQLCITKFFINYNDWPKLEFCFYPSRILKILTIRLDFCSLVFMKMFFTDSQFSFCISIFCFLLFFPHILRGMVKVILWSSNAHYGKGLPLVVSGKSCHYLLSLSQYFQ